MAEFRGFRAGSPECRNCRNLSRNLEQPGTRDGTAPHTAVTGACTCRDAHDQRCTCAVRMRCPGAFLDRGSASLQHVSLKVRGKFKWSRFSSPDKCGVASLIRMFCVLPAVARGRPRPRRACRARAPQQRAWWPSRIPADPAPGIPEFRQIRRAEPESGIRNVTPRLRPHIPRSLAGFAPLLDFQCPGSIPSFLTTW